MSTYYPTADSATDICCLLVSPSYLPTHETHVVGPRMTHRILDSLTRHVDDVYRRFPCNAQSLPLSKLKATNLLEIDPPSG